MAALAAGGAGRRVVVLEQLAKPGLKLLATGGGRCNLTHESPDEDYVAAFGRQGRFILPALEVMGPEHLRQYFAGLGVPTHIEEGGLVFLDSNSARSVQSALLARCDALGVQVLCDQKVERLTVANPDSREDTERPSTDSKGNLARPSESPSFLVTTTSFPGTTTSGVQQSRPLAASQVLSASRVIIATGGKGYAQLGGTGGGYELARQAGHEITPLYPALVPLLCGQEWPRSCAGIAITARVWLDLPGQRAKESVGPVLFTHRGVSGPAVLNLSGLACQALGQGKAVTLHLALQPSRGLAEWRSQIDLWRRKQGSRRIGKLLADMLPARLAEAICRACGLDPVSATAQLTAAQQESLADTLSDAKLTITGSEGWQQAMVTGGGVALKQVDPRTMNSRICPGLFLAGEVLDLHGPSGGYNLQWALASGYLAGRSTGF